MAQRGDGGSSGGGSLCTVDNGEYDTQYGRKNYHRHTPVQIERLEAFYKLCPHPDERQRRQLGMELQLEPKQIKFWFQNKRTQTKAQCERAAIDALCSENDKIQCENAAMRKALKDVMCPSCGGPSVQQGIKQDLQRREEENSKLKMEYDRLCTILVKLMGRPLPETTFNLHDPDLSGKESGSSAIGVDSSIGNINADSLSSANQMNINAELEMSLLAEIAASAMDELIKLLRVKQPLWIKSSAYDQYILDEDYYRKNIAQYSRCRYPIPRVESSMDSGIVAVDARSLVELYMNPDVWAGIFPSIVYKTRTMDVLEAGVFGNRSGALQLVYEQMHILTPLVQSREFCVLRYCQQIQNGIWIIVDVSCDYSSSHDFSTYCWKYPSGSMIHEMSNGLSKVTFIEHVEVNGNFHVHPLYEDLVKSAMGFGARRWITTLQRAVERYTFSFWLGRPGREPGGGRRSIVVLACRMVKSYCSIFSFLRSSELMNEEVQMFAHKSSGPGQPVGIIFSASTSFWVPASTLTISNYLSNPIMRPQWDDFCNGNPVHEVIRIPTGSLSENCISVLQPVESSERIMLLQESSVDELGSYLVYAPFDEVTIREVANGLDSSAIPVLACGFSVTSNGVDPTDVPSSSTSVSGSGGSLLTVAFQFLASDSLSAQELGVDIITRAEGFVTRIANVVKSALSSSV